MCGQKGFLAVQENFGHVAECGCGTLHVTVGPVSLSLDSQALRRLHEMLGNAIAQMESDSRSNRELTEHKSLLMHSSHLALRKVMKLKH